MTASEMSAFPYRDGALETDGVPLERIAAAVGTPCYVYSAGAMEASYRRFAEAVHGLDALICYALKANSNLAVIRTFARLGAGADVVSEGELARALAAGVAPGKIVFAGVGKQPGEMAAGLAAGILQFNVESEPELLALDQVAQSQGRRAAVAVRINPDVDAKTHAKITTGRKDNKFGIDIDRAHEIYGLARSLPGIDAAAVAVHIGSQLTDLEPFRAAFARVIELVRQLRAAGHAIRRVDLGGGLGIDYHGETPPPVERYADMVREMTRGLDCHLVFEPGRHLVGNAGALLTRVIYVKRQAGRSFIITDAAMNDLMRPALYEAYHRIRPLRQPGADATGAPVDIVGPVCESTDIFARDRTMPPLAADDLLAIDSSGAYGAVMASTYNSRALPPEVLVRNGTFAVVKPRQPIESLFADEVIPDWLDPSAVRAAAGGER
jgi:diaminopimelate decarboxylase